MRKESHHHISQEIHSEDPHHSEEQSLSIENHLYQRHNQFTQNPKPRSYGLNTRIVIIVAVLLACFYFWRQLTTNHCVYLKLKDSSPLHFPKILWLYTDNELQAESMYQLVYLHHHNHTFITYGYQVRLVNSLTAYDYISDNQTISRITYTMQNSKIDEGVNNVLKLALLRQHGGVMINNPDTVFPHSNLSWIENMFNPQKSIISAYKLPPEMAQIFLYSLQSFTFGYSPAFIAARPNASLICEAFEDLLQLISTGSHPQAKNLGVLVRNSDTQVDFIRNGLSDVLNLVIYKHQQVSEDFSACSYFGLQSLKNKNQIKLNDLDMLNQQKIILKEDYLLALKTLNNNYQVDIILNVNQPKITAFLDLIASNINTRDPQPLPKNSLIAEVLSCPHNREIFVDPLLPRDLELCLIMMENLSKVKVTIMREAFQNQTYSSWKLILPTDYKLNQSSKVIIEDHFVLMEGRSTKVQNIEQAATKHCHPKSYAVLLNFGDYFKQSTALEEIARAMKPRDMMGAFIALQFNGSISAPQAMRFHRGLEGIVNPNINKMELILNHLRVFSVQVFRHIPQFDLRDMYGKYFQDRIIFLMTLLEMIGYHINQPNIHYIAKKYNHLFNMPNQVIAIKERAVMKVFKKEKVNTQQLRLTRARLECENLFDSIYNSLRWKVPFTKLLAFNPGNEFVSIKDRKGPQVIPKIIHQVWLGGKLPPAKQYFYDKVKKMYPDYEIKLWRNENVTRENFPMTYDVMQTLIEFHKRSPYSKLATVTDILRHQLLYHQGGFWKDAGVNLLRRVFDHFLTYKLAISVDKTFRYRWLQGMCFYANAPKLQNLFRITNYRNINRMRIYHNYAMIIAGPIDFRNLVIGQEEYDPEFLMIPYEAIYPAQTEHPLKDLCLRSKEEIGNQKYQVEQRGCYLLAECDQIYPLSIGVEHSCYGNSWTSRKNSYLRST